MKIDPEFVEKCEAAMAKPAPRDALRFIASCKATILVKGTDIYLDTSNGRRVRHSGNDRIAETGDMMGLAGAWPLIAAGMVDQFGCITPKGYAFLAEIDA